MYKTDFYEDRLRVFLEELKKSTVAKKAEICGFKYKTCGYKAGNDLPVIDESFSYLEKGDRWGGKAHTHAWFYKKIEVPQDMQGHDLVLNVNSFTQGEIGGNVNNPQFIVYVDGKLVQGIDVNHQDIYFDKARSEYEVYLYAYTASFDAPLIFDVTLLQYDEAVREIYYKISVLYEVSLCHKPVEKVYCDIETYVTNAINMIDLRKGYCPLLAESAKKASAYLEKEFFGKYVHPEKESVITIGHTHIDVAWLWTLSQTREKTLRSFSTVVALMKKYPEYRFMSSQAQLYKYTKQECPELYEEIKEMVKQGRWEVEGAMWVEADCNLSSGESLVRQVLYGKKFFMDEFGVDCKVLWLPDVFGYSAALPQILRKSGVDKFVTSKISWNETNMMPCDTFFWKGIDGTDVFTYFLTAQENDRNADPKNGTTYNPQLNASYIAGAYNRYQQKDISDEAIVTFGYGDGGGGPTREHLENYGVLKRGIPGMPTAKMEFAGKFLERVKKKAEKNPKTPSWQGELYLEYHRGTYTSMAKNKRYNRKSEFLYENAETVSVMSEIIADGEYPKEKIYDGWETILLNQFHDIIPGSSIKAVYDESWQQYEEIISAANDIVEAAEENIASKIATDGGILVFNPNSFEMSGCAILDGKTVFVKNIPAKGYKVVSEYNCENSIKVTDNTIENRFYKLTFDKKGTFTKIYDKKNKRHLLKSGARGNVIMAYEDLPRKYDNWEISNYYTEKSWEVDDVISVKQIFDGARAGIEITKRFLDSILVQKIYLYEDIDRIDFENDFDWKESHIVLKTEFPLDINADRATYDIQFGAVERPTHKNTSWDAAKFEVCAHKFADLSEYGYGVSILNDCKYGHDIHDGVMKLTLLKCGTHPNPMADKCRHEFTYSLVPHSDDYKKAGIVRKAYELNIPLRARRLEKQTGNLPESFSLVSVNSENVFIETVKKAEKNDGYVIRMYESFNQRTEAELTLGFDAKCAYICDLLENEVREVAVKNRKIKLSLSPFEIVTVKVQK